MQTSAVFVVPCYNEERRLDADGFRDLSRGSGAQLLFVNDGSTDSTHAVLSELCDALEGRAGVLDLPRNVGKGEAARRGMLAALESGADIVAYYDADLATPPEEMVRLLATLTHCHAQVAMAARVALLGTRIQRRAYRHYLGRIFATFASLILDLPVYDTQCGAKAFKRSRALEAALSRPFSARWAFDVELLGRLLAGTHDADGLAPGDIIEMPLRAWTDVGESKLRPHALPLLGIELMRVQLALARWRREARRALELPAVETP